MKMSNETATALYKVAEAINQALQTMRLGHPHSAVLRVMFAVVDHMLRLHNQHAKPRAFDPFQEHAPLETTRPTMFEHSADDTIFGSCI